MRRGSLHAVPVKVTPNGVGFGREAGGKPASGTGTSPNGTMIEG